MQPRENRIYDALNELERDMHEHSDQIMSLADCVGVVLLHWDSLDAHGQRELLARVDLTVRMLENEARLVSH